MDTKEAMEEEQRLQIKWEEAEDARIRESGGCVGNEEVLGGWVCPHGVYHPWPNGERVAIPLVCCRG